MKIRRAIALIIALVGILIGWYFASAFDAGWITFIETIQGIVVSMILATVGICWYDILTK